MFKCEYAPEPYINVVTCRAHRSFLAKLRGGFASLEIETGRYVGTQPDLRVCKLCKTGVEDEMHFTLHCAALCQEWMPLINHMYNHVFSTLASRQFSQHNNIIHRKITTKNTKNTTAAMA